MFAQPSSIFITSLRDRKVSPELLRRVLESFRGTTNLARLYKAQKTHTNVERIIINDKFPRSRNEHNPLKYKITSVAHPLFVAECVQGLPSPPQLVQATISFGPLCSRRFSPCKDSRIDIFILDWEAAFNGENPADISNYVHSSSGSRAKRKPTEDARLNIDSNRKLMHAKCRFLQWAVDGSYWVSV